MSIDPIQDVEECCDVASSILDGKFGWQKETIALIVFVVIFNLLAKWILKRLHRHFEVKKQVWKDSFVLALYAPLSTYTWFFAAVHSVNLIFPKLSSETFLNNMHLILEVFGIICLAWFLLRWKMKLIQLVSLKSKQQEISLDRTKIDVIDKALTIIIFFFAILLILEITGRSVSTLIAFGGIGGLAIAFASQEVIANFFSGLMIYLTHPFGVGDWINLPERNIEGYVEEIGWYTTRVRTFEKRPIYVPNAIFSKIVVETPSRMSHRQLKETIHLRFSDMKVIQNIINDIVTMLNAHQHVAKDQKSTVNLEAFGTYSLDVVVTAYLTTIETEDFVEVKQEILFQIIEILEKYDAELASPITIVDIPKGIQIRNT